MLLLDEIAALDPVKDGDMLLAKYAEAAALVDRNQNPLKWAALRATFGALAFNMPGRLDDALQAFRESLPYWDRVTQRAQWTECKSYIGWILFALGRRTPPESEEAIECLEATLADYPEGTAEKLADYYAQRVIGDPLENWKKRVQYLDQALAQVSAQREPVHWALLRNGLANALPREPGGDFARAVEERIRFHQEALAVLTPTLRQAFQPAQQAWIAVCIDTSEAYMARVGPNAAQDLDQAGFYARTALAACNPATPREVRACANLAVARVLNEDTISLPAERGAEALALCATVDGMLAPGEFPAIMATNWKFKALAHLQLLRLGQTDHLEFLLQAIEAACSLLDPVADTPTFRVLTQIAADGLLLRGDHARAIDYLVRAERAGEASLQQASSRAGRLECIFDLHDASALLGYCLIASGDIPGGLEAIDRNKGRIWRQDRTPARFAQFRTLAPSEGALLFPSFGPDDGYVVVVTRQGEQICHLKDFGHRQLQELLMKDIRNSDSDAWMACYVFRHSRPAQWSARIDGIGITLFERLWWPVLATMQSMGVPEGSELVWFPQAGLSVLPLHAAWSPSASGRCWITERYAVRYASSARCLLDRLAADCSNANRNAVLISNPPTPFKNLPSAALEMAWACACEPAQTTRLLVGSDANKCQVLAELENARLAHFATHGVFNVEDPFQSSLVLAGGEMLSLDALLPVIERAGLCDVILSACETAVVQAWRRPDEMIGFPTAFLEHGATMVLATLWPVDDLAAAFLVSRFYQEWRTVMGATAAQALRAAQNWLRNATCDMLYEVLAPMVDAPDPLAELVGDVRNKFFSMEPDHMPFAHPQYWAAFTVSGR